MKRIFGKIGCFLLGGLVSTIGYMAGNMNNLTAQNDIVELENLLVKDQILVGDINGYFVSIKCEDDKAFVAVGNPGKGEAALYTNDEHSYVYAKRGNDDIDSNVVSLVTALKEQYIGLSTGINTDKTDKVSQVDEPKTQTSQNSHGYENTIIVEVMNRQIGLLNNEVMLVAADIKMPSGKKIHIKFSNPQTPGIFEVHDKIRIRQKGSNWEFIEHVP